MSEINGGEICIRNIGNKTWIKETSISLIVFNR
jgi:hypothetical protein